MSDTPLIDALAAASQKPDMVPAGEILEFKAVPQTPEDYKKQKAEELYGYWKKADWKSLTQFFLG